MHGFSLWLTFHHISTFFKLVLILGNFGHRPPWSNSTRSALSSSQILQRMQAAAL